MIEAEITCDCPAIQLADLQMALTRGMVVYLDADKARKSLDVQRAVRARGITVKYVQRYREKRPEPLHAPTLPEPVTPITFQMDRPLAGPDMEELAERVASRVTSQMTDVLNQALATLVRGNFPRGDGVYHQPTSSKVAAITSPVVQDDIPVFIPSKIGRDDLQPAEVKATEGEAGSVLDAAAALKAARKGKG